MELNDPYNLNPQYKPLPKTEPSSEEITQWNKKVENKGVRADRIWKWNFWQAMGVIGIIAILIVAGSLGVWAWTIYQDGTMVNPISLVCSPNITLQERQNTCTCGECKPIINITCPSDTIKLYCGNSS